MLRLRKHPLHPAIVHFPICLWSLATAFDIALYFEFAGDLRLSTLLHVGALVFALPTMFAGLADSLRLAQEDAINRCFMAHISCVCLAMTFYGALVFLRWESGSLSVPNGLNLSLSIFGFFSLLAAAYFGANLVYKYGVGVSLVTTKD